MTVVYQSYAAVLWLLSVRVCCANMIVSLFSYLEACWCHLWVDGARHANNGHANLRRGKVVWSIRLSWSCLGIFDWAQSHMRTFQTPLLVNIGFVGQGYSCMIWGRGAGCGLSLSLSLVTHSTDESPLYWKAFWEGMRLTFPVELMGETWLYNGPLHQAASMGAPSASLSLSLLSASLCSLLLLT